MKYVLFILSLFMTLNCIGQSLSPTRDVEATDDGIIVTYRFHGGFHQDDPLHPGAKFWKIPGFALIACCCSLISAISSSVRKQG